ncbi:related to Ribonuclease III [Phialocephala subalpina]|uniref:Related to Ribonuclease III n=1 Tax=Phialocephala subalpina TaxID=576137 RepID=A0A1L7WLV0_9HELO|nr:related to Ribonuclease III [Phialocephala subalpina]
MQKLFNKHKRKHQESPGSEERSSKQKKHNDFHEQSSFGFPYESARPSLDIPLRNNSPDKGRKGQKIANLIRALDEALDEEGMDETLGLIGDDNLSRCLDLRTALKQKKLDIDAAAITSPPASQPQRMSMSHDYQNIPKTMSAFSLTGWKSSTIPTTLPPLPKILDPTLEASAFTHIGCGSGSPTDLSYERLEWVGDAYVELTATLLISQTFPSFKPGKCAQLRERLVKNVTLAGFSHQYGFDKRVRLPEHFLASKKSPIEEKTKIFGDIFEAYVAAIILADPQNGVMRASEWLKDLWGMTIAKDIIAEERQGLKIDSPMWRLRGHTEPIQAIASTAEKVPPNPKERLQKILGSKGIKIEYKDAAAERKDKTNKLPLFTVGVYLTGWGETGRMLGSGTANGKKEAGFKAAEMALSNKRLMKMYTDQKEIFDAQLRMEKEALEAQQQQEGT